MRYPGGKFRVANKVYDAIAGDYAAISKTPITETRWIEPFCGMASVGRKSHSALREFSDLSEPVISYLRALQRGWQPPESGDQKDYERAKILPDSDPRKAFFGFGGGFGGCYFASWSKPTHRVDFIKTAYRGSLKLQSTLRPSDLIVRRSYDEIELDNRCIVYCDPPYWSTIQSYSHILSPPEYFRWLAWLAEVAEICPVYISEMLETPLTYIADPIATMSEVTRMSPKKGLPPRKAAVFKVNPKKIKGALKVLSAVKPESTCRLPKL